MGSLSPTFHSSGLNPLHGARINELETPCLCLDMSNFEANLRKVATSVAMAGKHWRPHSKCHKSPEVARRCLGQGAIGLTCAKVSEAELFSEAGILDLLIAHLPVGLRRTRRMAQLCRSSNLIVTCDHYVQAIALSEACMAHSVRCRVLVDINIGMDRTGVRPGRDALELARGIERLPGLKLAGIMGYEGHALQTTNADEKRRHIDAAMGILSHAKDLYQRNGLCCEIVSASGTGSLQDALRCEAVTEVQAGGAIFGDPYYLQFPGVDDFQPALSVLSTVVSRPAFDRAVLDAGRKAITTEKHPPTVKGWPDARIVSLSTEHTVLELGPSSRELRIGDPVELIVGYSDLTTMLHDHFFCLRDARLEAVWPIVARGRHV